MKAEYWTNPKRWTAADLERAGIRIKSVAGQACDAEKESGGSAVRRFPERQVLCLYRFAS
jgi:hypothetical protein